MSFLIDNNLTVFLNIKCLLLGWLYTWRDNKGQIINIFMFILGRYNQAMLDISILIFLESLHLSQSVLGFFLQLKSCLILAWYEYEVVYFCWAKISSDNISIVPLVMEAEICLKRMGYNISWIAGMFDISSVTYVWWWNHSCWWELKKL